MLNTVANPIDALDKANVDPSFLGKLKSWINSPAYSLALPLLGIDKNVALEKITSLEKMMGKDRAIQSPNEFIKSSTQSGLGDDLEKFKRGLKSLK